MAAIPQRTTQKYPKLHAISVYSYPDRRRQPEPAPTVQPRDYAERNWDQAHGLDSPVIAIAAMILFGLLFAIALIGG